MPASSANDSTANSSPTFPPLSAAQKEHIVSQVREFLALEQARRSPDSSPAPGGIPGPDGKQWRLSFTPPPGEETPPPESPSLLGRLGGLFSPSSAEAAAPAFRPQKLGDLSHPAFKALPMDQKNAGFAYVASHDPDMADFSAKDLEDAYKAFVTPPVVVEGLPLESPAARDLAAQRQLRSAQPPPGTTVPPVGSKTGLPPYVAPIEQGMAQAADSALGLPGLAYKGLAEGLPAVVDWVREQTGLAAPGEPSERVFPPASRWVTNPVETALTGGGEFAPLEGTERYVKEIIRQTGGAFIGTRLLNMLARTAATVPLTTEILNAALQGVGGATGGEVGRAVGDNPWIPIIGELVGAVGLTSVKDIIAKIRQHLPVNVAERALGQAVNTVPQAVMQDAWDLSQDVQRLVPGVKWNPFAATGNPALRDIQAYVQSKDPALWARLRDFEQHNQQYMQGAFGARLGPASGVQPATETAVEAFRQPLVQSQADLATAATTGEVQIGAAQAAADVAAQQTLLEQQGARAATRAFQDAQRAAAVTRQANLATAGTVVGTLPRSVGETVLDVMARTSKRLRDVGERQLGAFKTWAAKDGAAIDPARVVQTPTTDVQELVNRTRQLAVAEVRDAPDPLGHIQDLLNAKNPPVPPPAPSTVPPFGGSSAQFQPAAVVPKTVQPLSMQDMQYMRTANLEHIRTLQYGTREYKAAQQFDEGMRNIMQEGARNAGDPGVWDRYRAFASTYRDGIIRFTHEGWEDLLRLRRGVGRSPHFGPPRDSDYAISNMDVLKTYWAAEPIGGKTGRGTSPADKFRLVAKELAAEPDGKEALIQFAAQDFYDATMRTGTFDMSAAQQWMVDHQNKLNVLPELRTAFAGVRNQVERLRQVEAKSASILETLSAERLDATRRAQDAALQKRLTSQTLGETHDTVKSTIAAAKQGVDDAVQKWKEVFGSGDAADAAQDLATANNALGTDAKTLVERVGQLTEKRREYALSRMAEGVKEDPQTIRGLTRALWEDFWRRKSAGADSAAANYATDQLAKDFWLANPDAAMAFLTENKRWFERYYAKDHYANLVTLARGMQLNSRVLPSEGAGVAPALRDMTRAQRWMYRLGIGVPVATVIAPFNIPVGLGSLIGGVFPGEYFAHMADHKRIAFLNKALLDTSVAELFTMGDKAKIMPTKVLQALWYTTLSRAGLLGQEVSDAATAP